MRSSSLIHTVATLCGLFTIIAANIEVPYATRPDDDSLWSLKSPARLGSLSPRALPNAPDGYAPKEDDCPSIRPVVRSANDISPTELSWLKARRTKATSAMCDLLDRIGISDFDAAKYFEDHAATASALPVIAIAASGGGYRALMSCGGAIAAFDSRVEGSMGQGQLGGLLQSSTYFSGLSGGSWLVGSIYLNNFTTITALMEHIEGSSLWEFEQSIISGPSTVSNYYRQLLDAVDSKVEAGFEDSITDFWGRSLSYQLINASQGGISYTWSSIALHPEFIAGNMPLPIAIAVERAVGETAIPLNATIFEFNPWEFGSFDPTTYGFVPLEFIGSNFSGGVLPTSEGCVRGYDNAGYVMGTSSSLFNAAILELDALNASTPIQQRLQTRLNDVLAKIGDKEQDIAIYKPNPFFGHRNESNKNAKSSTLVLVDGAEDTQNIPLQPLLQPSRQVDVIFALDASADRGQENWPDGTSMIATYRRNSDVSGIGNGTGFPTVPSQNTFINLGLNQRPTFFGCNASSMTTSGPLVVYLPNSPYSYYSNVSTFQLEYKNAERNGIVQNGYDVATMGNGTLDATWPTCVGCAILSRSLDRTGTMMPSACQTCFSTYCWDGTINDTEPEPYHPTLALQSRQSNEAPNASLMAYSNIMFVILVSGLIHVF